MRDNTLKTAWAADETTIGLWLSTPNLLGAEQLSSADPGSGSFDYVNIDMQHGVIDYSDVAPLLMAMQRAAAIPTVRVPWNEPGIIGKVLDAGAMGVIVPMVNTVAEAEAAVSSCFYQPKGSRSHGPIRAGHALSAGYDGEPYAVVANDHVLCIPMIETVQAVENLDEILAVPGIDAVYVGPADLSRTLGLAPAGDHDDQTFVDALDTIVAGCRKAGVTPGIHASPGLVAKRQAQGFRMITATSDHLAAMDGARAALATARGEGAEASGAIY